MMSTAFPAEPLIDAQAASRERLRGATFPMAGVQAGARAVPGLQDRPPR